MWRKIPGKCTNLLLGDEKIAHLNFIFMHISFLKDLFCFMCMSIHLHVCICIAEGSEKALDTLELELQIIVIHSVGACN